MAAQPADLGQMLADGKVDIGVFHGIEFVWAKQKHSELHPLFIAYNKQAHLQACLVVRAEDKATGFADLKGKPLALPRGQRIHCQLFMERECQKRAEGKGTRDDPSSLSKCQPEEFFSSVTRPPDIEVALDGLVDGGVQAAIVDVVGLDSYKQRKPTRFDKMRIVQKSEIFPASVIAYRAGTFDGAAVNLLKQRMANATGNQLTRQLLTLWKLTAIEPVPSDFEETMANILKCYPPPDIQRDRPDKDFSRVRVSGE
jgi:ABC-type phosphate/phosphonate transport system substrate-binding protein